MSVSNAEQRKPAPLATSTSVRARSRVASNDGRNAPEPTLTSMTRASSPAASFLDRIDATISGIDSTVAVTSRMAYRRRSAGARSSVWPMIAQPAARTAARRRSRSGWVVVTGDAVQLVQRAASMAQSAARDHRHIRAARRHDRRQHQAHLVADAAGRVLVENRTVQIAPGEAGTGSGHGVGERDSLRAAHAVEENGHGERRHLALGDAPAGQPRDELGDLALIERAAVALLTNDFLRQSHAATSPLPEEGCTSPVASVP